MVYRNNYAIQADAAKKLFLSYDAQKLAWKLRTKLDERFLYTRMIGEDYRISRTTGDVERFHDDRWIEANSFHEVLTLFDLVCDSREDRCLSMRWKNLRDFGHQFHQTLLEERNPWAERFQDNPEAFAAACESLGGWRFSNGDIAYAIEMFDGLCMVIQLWFGDEEFPPQLRYLWDENASMYLRYETMYYALNLLLSRLDEEME